ncbi:hypothetical protein WDW89_21400 [Deltaproteobacteria bacterium TL4]
MPLPRQPMQHETESLSPKPVNPSTTTRTLMAQQPASTNPVAKVATKKRVEVSSLGLKLGSTENALAKIKETTSEPLQEMINAINDFVSWLFDAGRALTGTRVPRKTPKQGAETQTSNDLKAFGRMFLFTSHEVVKKRKNGDKKS